MGSCINRVPKVRRLCEEDEGAGGGDNKDASLMLGLPHDLALTCLARVPKGLHPVASGVSRAWRNALSPASMDAFRQILSIKETWVLLCLRYAEGRHGNKRSFRCYVLDPLLLRTTAIPPLPRELDSFGFNFVMISTGNEVMCVGFEKCLTSCFDVALMQWKSSGPPVGRQRCWFAGGAFDGFIYMAGGFHECLEPSKSAERLKVGSHDWEKLEDMHKPRISCAGVVFQGCFCVIGGYDRRRGGETPDQYSGEVWDPKTGQWTLVPELWPREVFWSMPSPPIVSVVLDNLYALRPDPWELMWFDSGRKVWVSLGCVPEKFHNPIRPFEYVVPHMCGLIGVDKELWVSIETVDEDLFMLATVPTVKQPLSWRYLPFCFKSSSFVVAASVDVTL